MISIKPVPFTSVSSGSLFHENRPKIEEFLKSYLARWQEFQKNQFNPNHTAPTLVRSGLGATGFTFFCSLDRKEFLLKWQKRCLAINEFFCNHIITICGFSTPKMLLLDQPALNRKLAIHACKEAPSMPLPENNEDRTNELLYMERLSGVNFKGFIQNGDFLELTSQERLALLSSLCEIVPFDLLIGNDDRFVRVEKDLTLFQSETHSSAAAFLVAEPSMNYGNVMVDARSLKPFKVHFIDSTTQRCLLPADKKSESDDFESFNSLYEEVEESQASSSSTGSSKSPRSGNDSFLEKKEGYEKLFSYLFMQIFKEPELFAEHVKKSILNGIDEVYKDKRSSNKWKAILVKEGDAYIPAFTQAICTSAKMLLQKALRISEELDAGFAHLNINDLEIPDLLQKNIQWIQSQKDV